MFCFFSGRHVHCSLRWLETVPKIFPQIMGGTFWFPWVKLTSSEKKSCAGLDFGEFFLLESDFWINPWMGYLPLVNPWMGYLPLVNPCMGYLPSEKKTLHRVSSKRKKPLDGISSKRKKPTIQISNYQFFGWNEATVDRQQASNVRWS